MSRIPFIGSFIETLPSLRMEKTAFVWKSLLLTAGLFVYLAGAIASSYLVLGSSTSLFNEKAAQWAVLGVVIVGIGLGTIRGITKRRGAIQGELVRRHGIGSFISHWYTAWGIFTLLGSGIYMGFLISPSFSGSIDTSIPALNVHYFAMNLILFSGFFFLADWTVHRDWHYMSPTLKDFTHGFFDKYIEGEKWPYEDKYLSSQKDAFTGAALIGLIVLLSGATKFFSHVFNVPANIWGWATIIHDSFAALVIIYIGVHVLFVTGFGYWSEFFSWFTGVIPRKRVEEEFPIWYKKLLARQQGVR